MSDLVRFVDAFEGRRVVVLGDLAVDCYVETRPARLSREAPVMVLRYERRRYMPGCAANTVMNLHQLGAKVVPIGIIGEDEAGRAVVETFRGLGIPDDGLVYHGRSVVKVRVTSGEASRPKQQVLRVDVEPETSWPEDVMLELIARAGAADGADGVVVSDYGYGAASPGLLRAVLGVAPKALVTVDSRERAAQFGNVDLLTPNEWEASRALGIPIETGEQARRAAQLLREQTHAGAVLLTRGNHGMLLFDGEAHMIPIAGSDEIVDPSGAGDTVTATAALARMAGASYLQAAHIANHAAGITVMKTAAQGASAQELLAALRGG